MKDYIFGVPKHLHCGKENMPTINPWTIEEENILISCYKESKKFILEKLFPRTWDSIYNRMRKLGLRRSEYIGKNCIINEFEIINLYESGFTCKIISNMVNCHRTTVEKILKKHNKEMRNSADYKVRIHPVDRFWNHIIISKDFFFNGLPCWDWSAYLGKDGYGEFRLNPDKMIRVHRFAYEYFIGSIPMESELDHLCHRRCCSNPWHLEAVSHTENVRRGHRWKDHSLMTKSEKIKQRKDNRNSYSKSYYKGIQRMSKNSWSSNFSYSGQKIYLGCFKTEIEAVLAYNKKAEELGLIDRIQKN